MHFSLDEPILFLLDYNWNSRFLHCPLEDCTGIYLYVYIFILVNWIFNRWKKIL